MECDLWLAHLFLLFMVEPKYIKSEWILHSTNQIIASASNVFGDIPFSTVPTWLDDFAISRMFARVIFLLTCNKLFLLTRVSFTPNVRNYRLINFASIFTPPISCNCFCLVKISLLVGLPWRMCKFSLIILFLHAVLGSWVHTSYFIGLTFSFCLKTLSSRNTH